MNPQEKQLLEESVALSRENNKILRKMLSIERWARVARIIYWIILIGASVGAYYYIQPYLEQLWSTYGAFQESVGKVNSGLIKINNLFVPK